MSIAQEKEEEISSSENESDESDHFDGLEGTFDDNSSYFDIFDNLLRKYVTDLHVMEEEIAN